MKAKIISLSAVLTTLLVCCNIKAPKNVPDVISGSLKFCESTLWNGETLYIANFGHDGESPEPLNNHGKGYISKYENGTLSTFIAPDGNLHAPKGMAIKDDYLFIADVEKIVVYQISDPQRAPQIITFPEGNPYVNDITINETTIYASVTNGGNIFKIEITNLTDLDNVEPVLWSNVPGANGVLFVDNKLYVASFPPDNIVREENLIYVISDLNTPNPEKLISQPSSYDGLAISEDKKTLYFTTWGKSQIGEITWGYGTVGAINLMDNSITTLASPHEFYGPADLSLNNGYLYIPDLIQSRVVTIKL